MVRKGSDFLRDIQIGTIFCAIFLCRQVDGIFAGEVGDDLWREEFGVRGDALGTEIVGIGL